LKLIWTRSDDAETESVEIFDVREDPAEARALGDDGSGEVERLMQLYEKGMAAVRKDADRYQRGGRAQLTGDELQQLEALGYLEP
jgi:hypothetical protein